MKKTFFGLLAISTILYTYTGCKKNDDPPQNLTGKVKTVAFTGTGSNSYTNHPATAEIFYKNGKVERIQYVNAGSTESSQHFYYNANEIIFVSLTGTDTAGYNVQKLNGNGLIDSSWGGINKNYISLTVKYIRDASGNIVEEKIYQVPPGGGAPVLLTSRFYDWLNGNLVRLTNTDNDVISTIEYSDKPYPFGNELVPGSDYLFKSKNLRLRSYVQPPPQVSPELTDSSVYTFNAQNQLLTETVHYISYGTEYGTVTRTFTYY